MEATANGVTIIVGIVLFATNIKVLMGLSAVLWLVFLLMQLLTWWMPYLTGKHLKQFPRELYDTHFKETLKILPTKKNRITPDAQHMVLQVLTLATLAASAIPVIF